jgi:hypothetical protein
MTTPADPYAIRDFIEDDRNFILATWLRSMRSAPCYKFVPNAVFYSRLEPIVWRLLGTNNVAIACITGEPDHIVGWACGTSQYLNFVYVKRHSRGCGLMGMLLDDLELTTSPLRCTFWTQIAEKYHPRWQYKPSLLET